MEDTFIPENQTISKIFNCDQIYRIPNYQRQYNWDDEQLDALWDDLNEAYKNKEKNKCYFLGSIVVVRSEDYLDLIDGQQRITTLMIMMDVLRKNFSDINKDSKEINFVDLKKLDDCILHSGRRSRLQLQSDPNYDAIFNTKIIKRESYEKITKPTKIELNTDNPEYKYLNTACFFYKKFKDLTKEDLNDFVNYIFFKTNIIKIVCNDESFAIKLFQVLNDRGQDLTNADLIKAEIFSKYDNDDVDGKKSFNVEWNNIIRIANNNDFRMDDFIVYYEYFKLKSNPERQVVDEIKRDTKEMTPQDIIEEMTNFSKAIEKVYKSTNPVIYSLRYIPWKAYVTTALASAYYVEYPRMEELLKIMRRFFYISFISGGTLNTIKPKSFKLIEYIVDKKPIEDIEKELNSLIYAKKMIKSVYEALNGEVYDEKYLKPLLLSLDYYIREENNTTFYPINRELHIDHILPKKYKTDKDHSWDYIKNTEEADAYLNTLGNMALLQYSKNEECENFGFDKKIRIYQGKNIDGTNKSGVTSFDTTRVIIMNAEKDAQEKSKELGLEEKKYIWDVQCIKDRKEYLMDLIENMLDITEDDIERNTVLGETNTALNRWGYNEKYWNNKEIIFKTLEDFIYSNDYKSYEEIPMELKKLNINSKNLIKNELSQNDIENEYNEVNINGITIYVKNCEDTIDIFNYLNVLKKYFTFEAEYIEDKDENRSAITLELIEKVYEFSKKVYEHELDFDKAVSQLSHHGMNSRSAQIYISNFIKMLNGDGYKRSISAVAANMFINKIRADYGNEFSKRAIKSLEFNVRYQNECGMKNNRLETVLNKQKEIENM